MYDLNPFPDPYIDFRDNAVYGVETLTTTAHTTGSPGWLQQKANEFIAPRLAPRSDGRWIVTVKAPQAVGISAEQWNYPTKVGNTWMGDPVPGVTRTGADEWQFYTTVVPGDPAAFIIVHAWYPNGTSKTAQSGLMSQAECDEKGAIRFCVRPGLRVSDGAPRPRIVGSDVLPASPININPPAHTTTTRAMPFPPGFSIPQAGDKHGTGNGNGITNGNGNGNGGPPAGMTWWDELPMWQKATAGTAIGVGAAWGIMALLRRRG